MNSMKFNEAATKFDTELNTSNQSFDAELNASEQIFAADFRKVSEIVGPKGDPGYTPIKGIDYFDGKDGIVGKDGEPGKDGVSATHSWNGTTLTITSASGTSSADLKGEQGNPGKDGEKGDSGVYVGSGDMPEDCSIQIDPTGEALSVDWLVNAVIAKLPIYSGEVVAV